MESKVHYPEDNKMKGIIRLGYLKDYYEKRGYSVWINLPVERKGLDMVIENEEEVIGLEVINWNSKWHIQMKRLHGMLENWEDKGRELERKEDHRVYRKRLVYSYDENVEYVKTYLLDAEVELQKIGYQHLLGKKKEIEEQVEGWIEE